MMRDFAVPPRRCAAPLPRRGTLEEPHGVIDSVHIVRPRLRGVYTVAVGVAPAVPYNPSVDVEKYGKAAIIGRVNLHFVLRTKVW